MFPIITKLNISYYKEKILMSSLSHYQIKSFGIICEILLGYLFVLLFRTDTFPTNNRIGKKLSFYVSECSPTKYFKNLPSLVVCEYLLRVTFSFIDLYTVNLKKSF